VIAKQERIRLSERTIAGLERARKAGRVGGNKPLVCDRVRVWKLTDAGCSMREVGAQMGISAASVCRVLRERETGI
jgi:DNA invertase Pin-like site-specific DNA recombinase